MTKNLKDEKLIVSIHEETKKIAHELKAKEFELIKAIQKVDEFKVYRAYNYPSLFKYLTHSLQFSESRAYSFITVARAGLKFPKLQQALSQSQISVSKAKRITAVLDNTNQEEWVGLARTNNHRSLEKLVAAKNPELANNLESSRYVSKNQIEVKIVLTEEEYAALKRAQELLCQKERTNVNLKRTVVHSVREFIKRNDPVIKAAKAQTRARRLTVHVHSSETQKRSPIPMQIYHQVQLRDKGQCQEKLPNGHKCQESKWIDIHHIKPVHQGGDNSIQNLKLLCKGHHQLEHWS